MNYLAHLYLSGSSDELKLGNFIGDHVKGKKYYSYSAGIQNGIMLHRRIDSFTDAHLLFLDSKLPFQSVYGLFSGIVTDLVFDHFLAKNWNYFSVYSLPDFAKKIHKLLLSHFFILPGAIRQFLPSLIHNKRLESYSTIDGFRRVLEIMSRYTSLPDHSEKAKKILAENYNHLQDNFQYFMNDIIEIVTKEFGVVIENPEVNLFAKMQNISE
jgi:acyl carrier protein phosphodiesterase